MRHAIVSTWAYQPILTQIQCANVYALYPCIMHILINIYINELKINIHLEIMSRKINILNFAKIQMILLVIPGT